MEKLSSGDLSDLYRRMCLIRSFELAVADLYKAAEIPGFIHLSVGQEASAVGVIAAAGPHDRLTTTHRGHGHLLARGVPPRQLMAEIFGKADGLCGGYAGSMHAMAMALGILGANGIVGAGLPLAVGSALEQRQRRTGAVTFAFFGEGALSTGSAHEAFVLAGSLRVPVLFVCEYNGWVEFSRFSDLVSMGSVLDWAASLGLAVGHADGADVRHVQAATSEILETVRAGKPGFLQVQVPRLRGHYEGDAQRYRTADEKVSDPLETVARLVSRRERDRIAGDAQREVDDAVTFARSSPWPATGARSP